MAQRKETKQTMKVRDLKPKKDAKGGIPPGPCGPSPNVQTGQGTTLPAVLLGTTKTRQPHPGSTPAGVRFLIALTRALGFVTLDSKGQTIWIVDAHGYGKRFIVRAGLRLS
jgi:hypothetical protein